MLRRLLAILAADVVGFSRLMSEDEAGTLATLKRLRAEVIDPLLASHDGRLVKLMGDGALVEFDSVVAAVACGVGIQEAMAKAMAEVPPERRIVFRLGIHFGDIIKEDGEIYGEGVNLAARLQTLARPGTICVSEDVVRQVRRHVAVDFDDLGEHRLKNLPEPVRVFEIGCGAAAPVAKGGFASVLDRPAVAVLPFTHQGDALDDVYFAAGITEDLITLLSYWRRFPVIAHNSVATLGDERLRASEAGRVLRARYIVEGSVRRAGDRVRITARLSDAALPQQLWAQRYDHPLGDVFALQDEITREIIAGIEPQLARAEERRALRRRPDSLDAWDCCLRAQWEIHQHTPAARQRARALLERALAGDPLGSYARSLLALVTFLDALTGWDEDPADRLAATLDAAQLAVSLDHTNWLAHALYGIALLWCRRDHDGALAAIERAVELNPSAVIAHQFLGCVLLFAGRPAEAIAPLRSVLSLDPRYQSPSLILGDLALSLTLLDRSEEAIACGRRAVAADPRNPRAYHRLVVALATGGRAEEAQVEFNRLRELGPDLSRRYFETTYPFREPAHAARFFSALRTAGWSG